MFSVRYVVRLFNVSMYEPERYVCEYVRMSLHERTYVHARTYVRTYVLLVWNKLNFISLYVTVYVFNHVRTME